MLVELYMGNYMIVDGLVSGADGTFQDYIMFSSKPLDWMQDMKFNCFFLR